MCEWVRVWRDLTTVTLILYQDLIEMICTLLIKM